MRPEERAAIILRWGYDFFTVGELAGPLADNDADAILDVAGCSGKCRNRLRKLGVGSRRDLRRLLVGDVRSACSREPDTLVEILKLAGCDFESARVGVAAEDDGWIENAAEFIVSGRASNLRFGDYLWIDVPDVIESLEHYAVKTRTKVRLRRLGISTVQELLQVRTGALLNVQGVGKTTLVDLIHLAIRAADKAWRRQDAGEMPDFFCGHGIREGGVVLSAVRNVAACIESVAAGLEPRTAAAPVVPFLEVWSEVGYSDAREWDKQIRRTGKSVTVAEYLQHLQAHPGCMSEAAIVEFLRWIAMKPGDFLDRWMEGALHSRNAPDPSKLAVIIPMRAGGKTLRDVSKVLGITVERVRQIEASVAARFRKAGGDGPLLCVAFLAAHTGNGKMLPAELLRGAGGEGAVFAVACLKAKAIPDIAYHAGSDCFYITRFAQSVRRWDGIIRRCVREQDNILSSEEYDRLLCTLPDVIGVPPEILQTAFEAQYKKHGRLYCSVFTGRYEQYLYILREHFRSGYHIADGLSGRLMRALMRSVFDEDLAVQDNALDSKIMSVGVLWGRGTYIHPDFAVVSDNLIHDLRAYIQCCDGNILPYSNIYNAFRDRLESEGVPNEHALHGLLKLHGGDFDVTRAGIVCSGDKTVSEELEAFFLSQDIVSREEIEAKFPGARDYTISQLLHAKKMIPCGQGKYRAYALMDLPQDCRREIVQALYDMCADRAVSVAEVEVMLRREFPRFMRAFDKYAPSRLMSVLLRYCDDDRLHFCGLTVDRAGSSGHLREMIADSLGRPEKIARADYLRAMHKAGVASKGRGRCAATDLVPLYYYDFDAREYVRSDVLGVTSEVVQSVKERVRTLAAERDFVSAASVAEDPRMPAISRPWTAALVASVTGTRKDVPKVVRLPYFTQEYWPVVYLGPDTPVVDGAEFLPRVLKDAYSHKLFRDKRGAYEYLKSVGLFPAGKSNYVDDVIARMFGERNNAESA